MLPASQLPNSVATATRTTGASFIPTSVIRNMVGQRTVDDRHLKDGVLSNTVSTLAVVQFQLCEFDGPHCRTFNSVRACNNSTYLMRW